MCWLTLNSTKQTKSTWRSSFHCKDYFLFLWTLCSGGVRLVVFGCIKWVFFYQVDALLWNLMSRAPCKNHLCDIFCENDFCLSRSAFPALQKYVIIMARKIFLWQIWVFWDFSLNLLENLKTRLERARSIYDHLNALVLIFVVQKRLCDFGWILTSC